MAYKQGETISPQVQNITSWLREVGVETEVKLDKYKVAWAEIPAGETKKVIGLLKEKGYRHLSTITGVDLPEQGVIELIYHLAPVKLGEYPILALKTKVPRDKPEIETITDLFAIAIVYEREVYDLLGVKFIGHAGLSRILLPRDVPEDYHPLRKK
ncbi:MAG: NADH-quinone oxidoreductase subunit C [Crenarchaeota archaeon]|nr:NADH-quinone oxidoreductase subunit C [Thermoproteota archaeon]MCR8453589.1 NADH-quinone oxidoreductase subunit C [Thermoproteota archaeon]MCR8456003.1 NADH-quinone oxidoreductase subunit C [Thermoproteota archaeon]MCR8471190.1 NADH-quinone oxidoreductase subunit C [Thermoproteota archaeon]MCR8472344.1 NADH-quinone oxidoreductase subunit C [Thermoproteota archaeon]